MVAVVGVGVVVVAVVVVAVVDLLQSDGVPESYHNVAALVFELVGPPLSQACTPGLGTAAHAAQFAGGGGGS